MVKWVQNGEVIGTNTNQLEQDSRCGITLRALSFANGPSHLELSKIFRSAGKRPDDVMVIPWKDDHLLVWTTWQLQWMCHR